MILGRLGYSPCVLDDVRSTPPHPSKQADIPRGEVWKEAKLPVSLGNRRFKYFTLGYQGWKNSIVCYNVNMLQLQYFHYMLYWVEWCPTNIHIYLEPQNVTLFGNRVFVDVIS